MAASCVRRYIFTRRLFTDYSFRSTTIANRCYSSKQKLRGIFFQQANVGVIAIGVGAGCLVGAGWSWKRFQEVKPPVLNNAMNKHEIVLTKLPDVRIARKIIGPTDSTDLQLVLFQYPTCPFCCKVRAFLDYYGFSYDVVEVDPVLRGEMSWSQYKKVPTLLAKVDGGYQQLNDSSMIISALRSFLNDTATPLPDVVKCYPTMEFRDDSGKLKSEIMNRYFLMYHNNVEKTITNDTIIEERKWRKWADDGLVHTLSPNVYRSLNESLESFKWFSEVGEWERLFPSWERNLIIYLGAVAMWGIGKRLKKRHNLKDDVRESLYDECNRWVGALRSKGTPFMGGLTPNLADLAVYGVLTSIEGCSAFSDVKTHTGIARWYYSVKETVQNHKGATEVK